MKTWLTRTVVAALIAALAGTLGAAAQQVVTVPQPAQAAVQYAPAQLDQMLAPIALYPDPLLSQVLMAATYPLEVVEADRWVSAPANAALKGQALAAAPDVTAAIDTSDGTASDALHLADASGVGMRLEAARLPVPRGLAAAARAALPWDPSVKSLVPFPQILHMMDSNLGWTEQLGEAFVADQAAVMNSVQRLRQRAQAAGRLASTPQEVVTTQGPDIAIEPVSPEMVYVPVYDPSLVYGIWPYPDYPPFYFPGFFPGVVVAGGIGFGWFGVAIVGPLWGWNHWDWRGHRLDIDRDRFAYLNGHRPPPGAVWEHNPAHRWGVPYRTPALRERYAGQAPQMQRSFRGYPLAAAPSGRPAPGPAPRG
jgi:hypothetical protein